jgi:hypothetical protein
MSATPFADLNALATHLRTELATKKFVLLYAYNGTGKTRLSTAFKDLGKNGNERDTLYFNAFTEDLFSWDNDLENDLEPRLLINSYSSFTSGFRDLGLSENIAAHFGRYCRASFEISYYSAEEVVAMSDPTSSSHHLYLRFGNELETKPKHVRFKIAGNDNYIKISRGEERIFIWCIFLSIIHQVLNGESSYQWVKHIYIDDPISSLDEHNAITVANSLAQMLKKENSTLKTVISTHHTLFFNVLCNELSRANKYFLSPDKPPGGYIIRQTGDTPFFHHVAALADLYEAEHSGRLFTHHFNMLRSILEKTASFHGYPNFSACIKQDADDEDGILHTRLINILSHGNYSLYEPQEMLEENKNYFRKILHDFINRYPFNPALFPSAPASASIPAATPVGTT